MLPADHGGGGSVGHLGRDSRRVAVAIIVCWLLFFAAFFNRGPVQWILCGAAVLGFIGVVAAAVIWPTSRHRLLVTVTDYRCEPERVRLTGTVSVSGQEEVYRPELTVELLDSRRRVVTAKRFWPTGQTRRHVQPGFTGTFLVSLPSSSDAGPLVPRISCREYPLTVTWAAAGVGGSREPGAQLAEERLATDSDALKGD